MRRSIFFICAKGLGEGHQTFVARHFPFRQCRHFQGGPSPLTTSPSEEWRGERGGGMSSAVAIVAGDPPGPPPPHLTTKTQK